LQAVTPVPRPYYDDDEDIEDEDFDIARRPRRRRENSGAASRLMGPAIALMVVAIVSLVVFAVACPINFISILNKPEVPGEEAQRLGNFIGAGVCIPLFMTSNLIVAIGGFLMYNRGSYGMAMTAAILAIVPCFSPCYLLGIPFGIWALVVLNDPDVKEAFRT
jgi:hypothetical protein